MTCSGRFLLSEARYGPLHELYIVLLPLLSVRTAKHVSQMARMYPESRGINNNGH